MKKEIKNKVEVAFTVILANAWHLSDTDVVGSDFWLPWA